MTQLISLQVSLDEANTILSALGNEPYKQVHQLVAKIHQQAQMQVQAPSAPPLANEDE